MEIFLALRHGLDFAGDIPLGILGILAASIFAIALLHQSIRREKQENVLIGQLQAALSHASEAMNHSVTVAHQERLRADTIAARLLSLTEQSARSEATLSGVTERLTTEMQHNQTMRERIQALEITVEQLVREIHEKDRSINELITLNRNLLSSLPIPIPHR